MGRLLRGTVVLHCRCKAAHEHGYNGPDMLALVLPFLFLAARLHGMSQHAFEHVRQVAAADSLVSVHATCHMETAVASSACHMCSA